MKLTKQSLAALALTLTSPFLVTASPVPEPSLNVITVLQTVECIVVDAVVKALTAYSSASPFCSVSNLE
jgi:hypothetical protein